MQLYLQDPPGVKPLYSRALVHLGMELHIHPQALQARMRQISRLETPRIERLWRTYSSDPERLSRAVRLLRSMNGFGAADVFYDGVEVEETFEKDFRPVCESTSEGTGSKAALERRLTPAMLVMILNVYFQLTPLTMVAKTPEVRALAAKLGLKVSEVVQVLDIFQTCDPYLARDEMIVSPLLVPCQQVWRRFGNSESEELAAYAAELEEYFK